MVEYRNDNQTCRGGNLPQISFAHPIITRILNFEFRSIEHASAKTCIFPSIRREPEATVSHLELFSLLPGVSLLHPHRCLGSCPSIAAIGWVVAFQKGANTSLRSNSKLGGGLEAFQDFLPFSARGHSTVFYPAGFLESIENAFALPPSETAGSPAHGRRRLTVSHCLRELPAFFGRVAKMRALEHLRIATAQ